MHVIPNIVEIEKYLQHIYDIVVDLWIQMIETFYLHTALYWCFHQILQNMGWLNVSFHINLYFRKEYVILFIVLSLTDGKSISKKSHEYCHEKQSLRVFSFFFVAICAGIDWWDVSFGGLATIFATKMFCGFFLFLYCHLLSVNK